MMNIHTESNVLRETDHMRDVAYMTDDEIAAELSALQKLQTTRLHQSAKRIGNVSLH